jgi:translocation and assembly module TamB
LDALGGSVRTKVFLENLQRLSAEANLRNFSLPVLTATLTGKQAGYDGSLNGLLSANGDLRKKGVTGFNAKANFEIVPGRRAIPLSGRLNVDYAGATGALDLGHSYLALPDSNIDLSGSVNKQIDVKVVSHNLNDFLPAVNFGSKPQSSLPVVLQGGTARLDAQITGNTSDPKIAAHLDVSDFAVEQRPFTKLSGDLLAASSGASVQNVLLQGRGLNTALNGSIGLVKWEPKPVSPLTANLALRSSDLADLAGLAGKSSIEASGVTTADIHINGTYGDPLGSAHLQITNGSVYDQAFSNCLVNVVLADQLITLSQLEIDAAGGRITSTGTFRHPRESFSAGHAQLQLAIDALRLSAVQALAKQNAGIAGTLQMTTNAAMDLKNANGRTSVAISNIATDLSARGLRIQNQNAGSLMASARTSNGQVHYNVQSDFAGSDVKVNGVTVLADDYRTSAEANLQNLSVAKALSLAGQAAIPVSGELSAIAHVNGTLKNPNADLDFGLLRARVYQEPINNLKGHVTYSNTSVNIPSIRLDMPAGTVNLSGSFTHPANDLRSGSLKLKLYSSDIQVSAIEHVRTQRPGLGGIVRVMTDLSANIREEHGSRQLLISNLNADVTGTGLHANNIDLGGARISARTSGSNLDFRLDSDIAQSRIHGAGHAQLTGDYPLRGNISFNNIRYSNLAPLFSTKSTTIPLEALVEGTASVTGPILKPDNLSARLQLDRIDVRTNAAASPTGAAPARTVELQNKGPIVLALSQDVVRIEQLSIGGRNTAWDVSGSINFTKPKDPLALNVRANVDLGLLQDADRDFYSSGTLALNSTIRGSLSLPRANGRLELRNASVNYAAMPNGLSNANGVILLNGTNVSIESLTAESGGGKVSLTGFVGLGTGTPSFNLKAEASKVRVRYSGLSATSNVTVGLTGNLRRSLLAGTVSIQRIAYASSSDVGSLLSTASTPPTTPSSPSPLLSNMRLDIHILTAPDIQIVSTYANRLSILANLTMRGTAENPGMLGRVTVTDGQLVFFGNTYTVSTGTINFYDPNSISPVLNISLETVAQGVNVTIGVTGPIDDLQLSYRSDPPLSFEQIVQLLATNTTPTNPSIAAHQPTPPQQSLTQMGESAVLGQAIANPLASRVQRVFGLSQLKIDPTISGNSQAGARVTLQEKVASNITFTYITDTSQTNAQIVQVQFDLTNNLSAVALRDYNGNVSVEFFYKFKRR